MADENPVEHVEEAPAVVVHEAETHPEDVPATVVHEGSATLEAAIHAMTATLEGAINGVKAEIEVMSGKLDRAIPDEPREKKRGGAGIYRG